MAAYEIRAAREDDCRALAEVFARAFLDDPEMMWVLPDPATRRERLTLLFATDLGKLHLRLGGTEVAVTEAGEIAAGAVWTPPGQWHLPWYRELQAAPGMARALRERLRPALRLSRLVDAVHPAEPHWFLAFLGTDPDYQGTGAAGALLRSGLRRADEQDMPVYLETAAEQNTRMYARYGFTVRDRVEVGMGAGPEWTMWRPAVGRSQ